MDNSCFVCPLGQTNSLLPSNAVDNCILLDEVTFLNRGTFYSLPSNNDIRVVMYMKQFIELTRASDVAE